MSNYLSIFTLSLEHNYYLENSCRAIDIAPTSSTILLLRRRGLIFRQIKENSWAVIATPESAGVDDNSDVLTLEVILRDPNFMHFTLWEGYDFRKQYYLELPFKNEQKQANAIQEIVATTLEKKLKGDVLTTVNIKLSNIMFDNAKAGNPLINTLVFNAPEISWEYVFIPRNGDLDKNLRIEENTGEIQFGEIKKAVIHPFENEVLHAISQSPILMKEHYPFNLSLIEIIRKDPLMKRVLIRQLPYPIIGRFITEESNVIRAVCYY